MTFELQQKIENIIAQNLQRDSEVLHQLQQLIYDAQDAPKPTTIVQAIKENLQELETKCQIETGLHNLDKLTGGFRSGELVVIGGRPAMGKTSFLLSFAQHISKTTPALFFSLEMSQLQITNRMLISATKIDGQRLREGKLINDDRDRLTNIIPEFGKLQLFIDDTPSLSTLELRARCQQQVLENDIKVIFVDYLQLMCSPENLECRELEEASVCFELQKIARDFNICIIAASQLNRDLEGRKGVEGVRPRLSDLRNTATERKADKVLLIHRPEYYRITEDEDGNNLIGIAEIIVAKNRSGAVGIAQLRFDNSYATFTNLE